jgi:hypothetical protein
MAWRRSKINLINRCYYDQSTFFEVICKVSLENSFENVESSIEDLFLAQAGLVGKTNGTEVPIPTEESLFFSFDTVETNCLAES